MNCPVRTDEDYLEHPEWNQNPPFLAPELTTRKDLNGTVNSREHDLNDPGDELLLEIRSANQEHGEKTSFDGPMSRRASNRQYSMCIAPTGGVLESFRALSLPMLQHRIHEADHDGQAIAHANRWSLVVQTKSIMNILDRIANLAGPMCKQ